MGYIAIKPWKSNIRLIALCPCPHLKGAGAKPNFPERARSGNQDPAPEFKLGEATAPKGNQAAVGTPAVDAEPAS